jgi:hypothetical protein
MKSKNDHKQTTTNPRRGACHAKILTAGGSKENTTTERRRGEKRRGTEDERREQSQGTQHIEHSFLRRLTRKQERTEHGNLR